MKTIKIDWYLKISWKLDFDPKTNKWFIRIYDNNHEIQKDIWFNKYENLDHAIKSLNYEIVLNINYKKKYSIMKYFYNRCNDYKIAWDKVKNIFDIDQYIIDNNIKIINYY